MRIVINCLENVIEYNDDIVSVLEIENRNYFYKIVSDFIKISSGDRLDNINFFDIDLNEQSFGGKIGVVTDYFNFNFDSKKISQAIYKSIEATMLGEEKENLMKSYSKIKSTIEKILFKQDLPITIKQDFSVEDLIKMFKLCIENKKELLDNLFLLLDIEKSIGINKLIVFINLKDYLSREELIELYKYSLYIGLNILLIDSRAYGTTLKYEKKLIVDENLDEFVL